MTADEIVQAVGWVVLACVAALIYFPRRGGERWWRL